MAVTMANAFGLARPLLPSSRAPRAAMARPSCSTPGWGQTCHLYRNACKTLPTLAPAMLLRPMREPSTRTVHYKRTVARVRHSPTPTALQVAMSTASPTVRHTAAARHALSALLISTSAATCGSGASSTMSGSVQQLPKDEARRCVLLQHTTRAHEFRRHRMHDMSWDERRE